MYWSTLSKGYRMNLTPIDLLELENELALYVGHLFFCETVNGHFEIMS